MLIKRRVVLQSQRLIDKKKRRNIIKLSIFLVIIFVLFIGAYLFLRLPFLNIKTITVSGVEALIGDNIKKKAEEYLRGNLYFIVPKSNLFVYGKEEMQNSLPLLFPEIKSVSLDLENQVLRICVIEKKATALWCDGAPKDVCYYFDDTGNVFLKAPDFDGSIYKKFYGSIEGDPIGKNFLDKATLSKIKIIYETFDTYKVVIGEITVVSKAEIKLKSIYDVEFLINLDKDLNETADNIITILTADRFKDSLPILKGVEYIDFRFGRKVFFKKN